MPTSFSFFVPILWSIPVSIGFAMLFNTPRRALWAVGLLGALGFGIKTLMLGTVLPDQVILASLAGASAVGILGSYFAHRVHTPPIVFTVPAVINMIPGKFGYEFIIGILKIVNDKGSSNIDFDYFMMVLNNGLKTAFILMSLAFGIIFPILIFNTKSVKNKDIHWIINKKVIRRVKMLKQKLTPDN
ncbi:MAG: threonine/serine exporter family protein [Flavobacteriaceae bacterium]